MHLQVMPKSTSLRLLTSLLLVLLCFSAGQLAAAERQLLILLSADTAPYRQVAQIVTERYSQQLQTRVQPLIYAEQANLTEGAIVVAVGTKAALYASENYPYQPTIHSYLPSRAYTQLPPQPNRSAVFVDQPIERQIQLTKLLLPEARLIGTVLGPSSIAERQLLHLEGMQRGLDVQSVALANHDNPIKVLQPVIESSDAFLALPDESVFNRATAKWSLYISLRLKKPLIGFSAQYVKAGAIAAVFSTPEQIGKQTIHVIDRYLASGRLIRASFPNDFTVATNPAAAAKLNLQLPSERQLIEALKNER